ncbi:hypothetical protein H0R92_11020 [Treponema sp. OMZ 840]|uniref:hypothetical protein n=1 Tax=Treponema sp. OMZ 840 TaxID=244313 RepID=UPI003D917A9C
MEELRSTEILDKEILEDTRKKAERILVNSESECKKILADVQNRVESIRKEKKAFYEGKTAAFAKDMEAAFPLEKQRYRVSFEHTAVASAITAFLKSLPESEKTDLIGRLLKRYAPALSGQSIRIQVCGFPLTDMKKTAEKTLSGVKILECTEMNPETASFLKSEYGCADGMLIETEDKTKKCRVTIGELTAEIRDMHSEELANTLFGGRLPE